MSEKNYFVDTRNTFAFNELIASLHSVPNNLPKLAAFVGPAGFGKTTAATQGIVDSDAYYLRMFSTWSKKDLADAIANVIGAETVGGTVTNKINEIIKVLDLEDKPLIIDEADYLFEKASLYGLIRDIHDGIGNYPIIFIGEENLPAKIKAKADKRFFDRLLDIQYAKETTLDEAREFSLQHAGVHGFNIVIADDLLNEIVKQSKGHARRIATNVHLVFQYGLSLAEAVEKIDLNMWGKRPLHNGEVKVRGV